MHLSFSAQLLTLFIGSLLVSIFLHSELTSAHTNEIRGTKNPPTKPICTRKKMPVTVYYYDESKNCKPVQYKVHYCSGACLSYLVTQAATPYQVQAHQCCIAHVVEVKRRTLTFKCAEQNLTQDVYIPIIRNCSCTNCPN